MSPIELENLLQLWGIAATSASDDSPGGYGANPIATAMQFALGSRSAVLRSLTNMDRSGASRRHIQGQQLTDTGLRSVPTWAVDPIRSKSSRSKREGEGMPAGLELVHAAIMTLHRIDTLRGTVVVCEYQLRGLTQAEKAVEVGKRLGMKLATRQYREELKVAKFGLLTKLAS